ncbi:TPA: putative holin-like toxin [Streptococcus suis]
MSVYEAIELMINFGILLLAILRTCIHTRSAFT